MIAVIVIMVMDGDNDSDSVCYDGNEIYRLCYLIVTIVIESMVMMMTVMDERC